MVCVRQLKSKPIIIPGLLLCFVLIFQNCSAKINTPDPTCTTLACVTLKYSLLVADIDGSNVSLIKTSSYQDLTHIRVSNDKNWVAYTTYNDLDSAGCASYNTGYLNTEIRAVQMDGLGDKRIIAPVAGELHSNNYWIGPTNEFTYLAGLPSATKFYRATVDSSMNLISGPTQIPISPTIFAVDPQANLATNKIVYPGLWDSGGGLFVKSIFIMNLSDSASVVGLSVGRDHAGTILTCADADCTNIMENDPKISPNGAKVAFMRRAPAAGVNGFGWHIFVVPVASPLTEADISYSSLGSDILKNEGLPEWIDDDTLIFSTIEIVSVTDVAKNIYTMKADGASRAKISLPAGFRYSDVFPFVDGAGKQRMIISAEKIGATCSH